MSRTLESQQYPSAILRATIAYRRAAERHNLDITINTKRHRNDFMDEGRVWITWAPKTKDEAIRLRLKFDNDHNVSAFLRSKKQWMCWKDGEWVGLG